MRKPNFDETLKGLAEILHKATRMEIALLIMWIIIGLINLIFVDEIPKSSYGLMWVVLICEIIKNLVD